MVTQAGRAAKGTVSEVEFCRIQELVPQANTFDMSRTNPQLHVAGRFPAGQPPAAIVEARRQLLYDDDARRPLDRPGQLLSGYYRDRRGSPLRCLIDAANGPLFDCETVFVVASADELIRCRAILRALAHPYYSWLDHGGRGGRPRLVFVEPVDDGDLLQGALDLVRRTGESVVRHDRWALIAALPERVDDEASVAVARCAASFIAVLRDAVGPADEFSARCFALCDSGEQLRLFPTEASPTLLPRMATPKHWDGLALLTAALVGADVVGLLKGMIWFLEDARKRSADECPVARLAAMAADGSLELCSWHHALDGLAVQFVDGVNESLKNAEEPKLPASMIAAYRRAERRRLSARPAGSRLHLTCEVVRRDRLAAAADEASQYDSQRALEISVGIEPAEIRLRQLNEGAVGEFCAWLSAAELLGAAVR